MFVIYLFSLAPPWQLFILHLPGLLQCSASHAHYGKCSPSSCCQSGVATASLLPDSVSMARLRGTEHQYSQASTIVCWCLPTREDVCIRSAQVHPCYPCSHTPALRWDWITFPKDGNNEENGLYLQGMWIQLSVINWYGLSGFLQGNLWIRLLLNDTDHAS